MDDGKIIDLFFLRSESAIDELKKKYGKLCLKLSVNITNNYQDAEECVNDALLAVWNTVPPNRPDKLISYVCRLTRNISLNRYKYNHMKKRNSNYDLCLEELENCLFDSGGLDEALSDGDISVYINDFLAILDDTDRMIFVRRFWYMDSYETISEMSKIKAGTLRVRMSRIKEDLKKFFSEKGVIV